MCDIGQAAPHTHSPGRRRAASTIGSPRRAVPRAKPNAGHSTSRPPRRLLRACTTGSHAYGISAGS
eukprot:365181-Chlamydomonas_euryale.AAC.3